MKYRLTAEPALLLALINSVVALLAGVLPGFTPTLAGAVNALAAAVAALVAAWATRPFPVTLAIGAFNTLVACAVAFWPALHFTQSQVGLVDAVIAAVFGVLLRLHVSPVGKQAPAPAPKPGM